MKKKLYILVLAYLAICALMSAIKGSVAIAMFGLLVFLLILLVTFWFANKFVKTTLWYKSTIPDMSLYPTNEWYREHLERNFDVVNIGSSSAKYAFDYSGLPVKAFNWGEQPQLLSNGLKVLKTYFSILKENGTVIISLCPLSGLDVEGKWDKTVNDKYYYILPCELIDDYKAVSRRRKYPLLYLPKLSIKSIIKEVQKQKTKACKTQPDKCLIDESKIWGENSMTQFGIDELNAPLSPVNLKGQGKRIVLLTDILSFCMERSLRPVIVIPPMHKRLSNKFTPTFRDNYIYPFIRKANTHNVLFLNYMDDERFDDERYFRNSFFMSEEGARKFTRIVLKDLHIL